MHLQRLKDKRVDSWPANPTHEVERSLWPQAPPRNLPENPKSVKPWLSRLLHRASPGGGAGGAV